MIGNGAVMPVMCVLSGCFGKRAFTSSWGMAGLKCGELLFVLSGCLLKRACAWGTAQVFVRYDANDVCLDLKSRARGD